MSILRNKKLVIGLGKTGVSMVHYGVRQGWPLVVMDSRPHPPGLNAIQEHYPELPIHCGSFDKELLVCADEILLSPGVSPHNQTLEKARIHNIPMVGDVELFARAAQAPVIAVTGTNGKGTVTTMVAAILKAEGARVAVGGNIGIPVLELLNEDIPDFYVLELSSAQLQVTNSLRPKSAALLNICADHEDYHQSFTEYQAAKHRISFGAERFVYCASDPLTYPRTPQAEVVSFGLDSPKAQQFGLRKHNGRLHLCHGDTIIMPLKDLALGGQHNQLNALAALALVEPFVSSWQAATDVLRSFQGLKYRCQWIRSINGVDWYNDSKGANTAATVAAINSVAAKTKGRLFLIMGGIAKQEDLSELTPAIRDTVVGVFVFGRDAKRLQALSEPLVATCLVNNLTEAVAIAHDTVKPKDAVLFSPACASFDMFNNAEERGAQFSELVEAMVE